MSDHPNLDVLRRGYQAFGDGDMDTLRELIAPDVVWHVQGFGKLDGDYEGIDATLGFFGRLAEETGGTLRLEVHDMLANDEHGVALSTVHATRGGKTQAAQAVNVHHLRDGRVAESWGAPVDPQQQLDFWS